MASDRLGPEQRAISLDAIDGNRVDLIVIGGGITGVGCALDAASRGLTVALFEQRDLASGTSSRSSKLIHGGVRYLEQLNFRLVLEALRERNLLTKELAPHLVKSVSFLYPLKHRFWERIYVGLGIGLYDLFAAGTRNSLPRHRHVGPKAVKRLSPDIKMAKGCGAIIYSDALTDDSRYTIAVARTAAGYGSHILTSTQVVDFLKDGDKVVGVQAVCTETGRHIEVRSSCVINATGVWTDDVEQLARDKTAEISPKKVRSSKGVHLVVPRDRIKSSTGLVSRTEKSVLFIIPWSDHWIIGTTDTDWALDRAHPAATSNDISYLLQRVNELLENELDTSDIQGVYVGLRPLLTGESEDTAKLSREHHVSHPTPGVVSIAGGKYTTYRVMARDAVNAAVNEVPRWVSPSRTKEIQLVGAENFLKLEEKIIALSTENDIDVPTARHLLDRHGDRIHEVFDIIAESPDLKEQLSSGYPYIRAEVVHAVRFECALHLEDVLTRRTRLSIESWDRASNAAPAAASLMAAELGWASEQRDLEIQMYNERVVAERKSQTYFDDESAQSSRLAAMDSRQSV